MKKKPILLYSDADLVIVEKPSGLLSIPDRHHPEKENLLDYLRTLFPEVYTVHRLDLPTTGLLCFALNAESHRKLNKQFQERTVIKKYQALVMGNAPDEGRIEKAIAEMRSKPGLMEVRAKGKPSLTEFRTLERFQRFSLLELQLFTGRTHQARVHLASIGHPIVGDEAYGGIPLLLLSDIKGKKYRSGKDAEERPLLQRVALHASALTLAHPGTGAAHAFTADLPKDLGAAVNQLRKWLGHDTKN